jgi:hypothetical protein
LENSREREPRVSRYETTPNGGDVAAALFPVAFVAITRTRSVLPGITGYRLVVIARLAGDVAPPVSGPPRGVSS